MGGGVLLSQPRPSSLSLGLMGCLPERPCGSPSLGTGPCGEKGKIYVLTPTYHLCLIGQGYLHSLQTWVALFPGSSWKSQIHCPSRALHPSPEWMVHPGQKWAWKPGGHDGAGAKARPLSQEKLNLSGGLKKEMLSSPHQ